MEVQLNNQQLVAVEYPGNVQNIDNMMRQLGSERNVSVAFGDAKKRLELSFRPEDPFCKPACGDKCFTTGMLVEIVRKRRKNSSKLTGGAGESKLEVHFLGFVKTIYKFKAMIDFQKLPIHSNKESLLPLIMPNMLQSSSWLEEETPLFVAPLFFSRFEYPQSGYTEVLPKNPLKIKSDDPRFMKSQARNTRTSYAIMTSFDNAVTPSEPKKEAMTLLSQHHIHVELKKKLDVLFEERPIWIKSGLLSRLKSDKIHLRYALGCTAYYFSSGPWRTLWVKFGYDPRQDKKSKIYQTMDFRINPSIKTSESAHGLKRKVFTYHTIPVKSQKTHLRIPLLNTDHLVSSQDRDAEEDASESNLKEEEVPSYILVPGRIPMYRQCYFQLCDVRLDEVQELIHQNDGREHFCHERDGWCDVGILDRCREIIARHIKDVAARNEKIEENVL